MLRSTGSPAQPIGEPFQANESSAGLQTAPVIASVPSAIEFVVVWESAEQGGDDPGIFGRRMASGDAVSRPELPLNGVTRGPQALPVVSAAAAGDGHVTIDDLAGALASALSGCAPVAAAATGAMPAGAAPSA